MMLAAENLIFNTKEGAAGPVSWCMLKSFTVSQTVCLILFGNICFRALNWAQKRTLGWFRPVKACLFSYLDYRLLLARISFDDLHFICFFWNTTVCLKPVTLLSYWSNNISAVWFTLCYFSCGDSSKVNDRL